MALVSCRECGREISDQALSCPHCGAPLRATVSPAPAPPPASPTRWGFGLVSGGCLAIIAIPILIIILIGVCSGIFSDSNEGSGQQGAHVPAEPAPLQGAVVVDLPALAGADQDSVASMLGEPFEFGPIQGAVKGFYRLDGAPDTLLSGASIEVAFVNGRADWITIKGQDGMQYSPAVLHQLNLPSSFPSFHNEHVIAWTGIQGFKEIRVFPIRHGGIDFVYVNVFTSP